MGSITFDFLTESFLFDDELIKERFSSLSDQEVFLEVRKYREHCLQNLPRLLDNIRSNDSSLKVLTNNGKRPVLGQLMQTALYFDQFVLDDPMFSLGKEPSEFTSVMSQYTGVPPAHSDKKEVAEAALFLKNLTPMIAADYVKLVPASYLYETPDEMPLYASENGFADVLPSEILQFMRDRTTVKSLEVTAKGLRIEQTLHPCRWIHVEFQNDQFEHAMFFNLMDVQSFKEIDHEEANRFQVGMVLPNTAPSVGRFEAWVNQSINRAAAVTHDRVSSDNILAASLGAKYITHSPFVFELLQKTLSSNISPGEAVVNSLMQMELPFLQNVDPRTLMKVRTEESDVFQNFRADLNKRLLPLRTIRDPQQLQIALQNISEEFSEIHIQKITNTVAEIRKKVLADAALLLASLSGVIRTGGFSLVAAAIALAGGYKTLQEYRMKVEDNPLFFLWKIINN